MAEGLGRSIWDSSWNIKSAGSEPSGKVHPGAITAMQAIDIDISHHTSQSIESLPEEFLRSLDYVITLCAEEVCPVILSNAKKLHWPMPDPAGVTEAEQAASFQKVRDEITMKIRSFQ
tara:strand:+ start:48438 stop:48791 length:354 start_codon:yes stop_codon:yes gene_type:complete